MDRVLDSLQKQQDKESQIIEGSKLLAEYLEWEYFPFNDLRGVKKPGWYYVASSPNPVIAGSMLIKGGYQKTEDDRLVKFICRNHHELRFYNSYDYLFEVIEKLEKEDLKDFLYKWEEDGETRYNFKGIEVDVNTSYVEVFVNWALDPPQRISEEIWKELPKIQRLFFALVDAVQWVNNIKNGKNT